MTKILTQIHSLLQKNSGIMFLFDIFLLLLTIKCVEGILGDCSKRNQLLNPTIPNSSIVIQSFYTAYDWRGTNPTYPFKWGPGIWNQWTAMMNNNWLTINPAIGYDQVHAQISTYAINFITTKIAANKTYILCVPLGNWGYWGNYLQCKKSKKDLFKNLCLGDVNSGAVAPPAYTLDCPSWFNPPKYFMTEQSTRCHL